MGLDTTHDCWHGPYSSFNRFRYSLGRQIGIDLDSYKGYSGEGTKDLISISHNLMPLFNHSDCDGSLTVKESKSIVRGLNGILIDLDKSIESNYDFKNRIIQFRDGCLDAISKKQKIYFR